MFELYADTEHKCGLVLDTLWCKFLLVRYLYVLQRIMLISVSCLVGGMTLGINFIILNKWETLQIKDIYKFYCEIEPFSNFMD